MRVGGESGKLQIRMHAYTPVVPYLDISWTWPAKWIEEATKERAKVTIYPACSLAPPREVYRAVQTGVADCTWLWVPPTPGIFPLSEIVMLPGLFPSMAISNVVMAELFRKYPQFEQQFSPKVKYLSTQVHMRADLHTSAPIRTLDDLKGKVIACVDDQSAKAMKMLGANVTQMPSVEMYQSLQRGVIQGCVIAWSNYIKHSLHEATKYHTLIAICPGVSHWIFNRNTWNKFTPQEQRELQIRELHFQRSLTIGAVRDSMYARRQHCTPEKGHEYIELSKEDIQKMKNTFRPVWNKWAERMEAKGFPAKAILADTEVWVKEYTYQ